MTVYIVTEGDYSDYHLCAVFDTREKAEAYIEKFAPGGRYADPGEVEEWEVNREEPFLRPDMDCYEVILRANGDTVAAEKKNDPYTVGLVRTEPPLARWGNEGHVRAWVLARSPEHAVKIVNERRAQAKAEGWLERG